VLFTREIGADSIGDSPGHEATSPVILQERIDKAFELRAVAYGEEVRFIKIDSQRDERTRLDFRRRLSDASLYSMMEDDWALAERCIAYCRALGLDSGVFDFAVSPDNQPIFFECNPNGQWGGMNEAAGGDIDRVAARYIRQRVDHACARA
jgi:hypothetical protein